MAKTKKAKRKKLLPIGSLKKKAWALFSQWLRLAYANANGMCQCVTCGRWYPWNRGIQAGHYYHGRIAIYFDLQNVHPQCEQCNGYKDGSPRAYAEYLAKRYGVAALTRLGELARVQLRWNRATLDRMIVELRIQIRFYGEKPCR